jgi:hypothetical protein
LPSVPARAASGTLVGLGLLALLVGGPYLLLARLAAFGVAPAVGFALVATAGAALAVLGGARYAMRPTAWFGPLGMASALVGVAYLLLLRPYAVAAFPPTSGVFVTVGYATVLVWALVLPLLALVGAAVTTWEDFARPGERLPYDFPA